MKGLLHIFLTGRGLAAALAGGLAALTIAGCASSPARVKTALPARPAAAQDSSASRAAAAAQAQKRADSAEAASATLSPASEMLVKACDNYLTLNPDNPKAADVLTIKASLYYNNKLFTQSRAAYHQMADKYPNTQTAAEAVRMIAQGFYEEKLFDSAQAYYRKLSAMPVEGVNRSEAIQRIAESIFRGAEQAESKSQFKEAAEQYQRISMEFPDAAIADIALFNASLCYEKLTEWAHVILALQQLLQKYPDSKLVPKAMFRIGISNAKLLKWETAAEAYLRMVARFPGSELAPTAMYNAGFAFETADKLPEAAATFEKMIQLYPKSEDAADILFRAGEIYGKLKNWEAVTRVNQLFTERFGNDADRVVQALCMVGIALYMQNKDDAAVEHLKNAVATFGRIKNPSTVNAYYAAKAQYTIGEITHNRMTAIALTQPRNVYQKQLTDKSNLLDEAVDAYSRVIKFNISEWTTRAICQIGQANEDFALGIFKQERPASTTNLADRIALELGIAQAVEKYFIEKALKYHEENLKLAIKEKLEDKYILISRQKLTYLPYTAGGNYLALAEIAKGGESTQKLDGFALIARKLELLQKIAPFQERATDLLLKCLEIGTTYQERDDFFRKASATITKLSLGVAQTYADVVTIALEAPIPPNFGDYEKFVYKTKLLKQIEGYEEQAMTGYLKTLKIAEAYSLDDESVKAAREQLAQLLFTSGRCKDLLCIEAFSHPPFPPGISEAEAEEYRGRFEEIGLKFQEQAFDVYKSILKFAVQKYAGGPYVTHAYVRLFQNAPEQYGAPQEIVKDTSLASASQWKGAADSAANWSLPDFNDSAWAPAEIPKGVPAKIAGFTAQTPAAVAVKGDVAANGPAVYFRRTFSVAEMPNAAHFSLACSGGAAAQINGIPLAADSGAASGKVTTWDLIGKLRAGKNVIAVRAGAAPGAPAVVYPLIQMKISTQAYFAKPPGSDETLPPEQVRQDVYQFPYIKNFNLDQGATKK